MFAGGAAGTLFEGGGGGADYVEAEEAGEEGGAGEGQPGSVPEGLEGVVGWGIRRGGRRGIDGGLWGGLSSCTGNVCKVFFFFSATLLGGKTSMLESWTYGLYGLETRDDGVMDGLEDLCGGDLDEDDAERRHARQLARAKPRVVEALIDAA